MARLVKSAPDVLIARYNTPENEHEEVKFSTFPHIRLYLKDNTEIAFWNYGEDPDNTYNELRFWMNEHSPAFRAFLDSQKADKKQKKSEEL